MSAPRIELQLGTSFYPHARRVIWREGSGFPDMSWPLPVSDLDHRRVYFFATEECRDPALRSALFALLAVDAAYEQMTMTDGRGKRDHVCAMLRRASRALPGSDPNSGSTEEVDRAP